MFGRAALVLGSALVTLLMLELGCRLWRGPAALLDWSNIIRAERQATLNAGAGRLKRDSELGFVLRPGFSADGITYDLSGHRLTPAPAGTVLAEPPVLVVGDSYAHGDEVSDEETWAALLQPLIGRRTVNAGVSGYGLDQAVLRAVQQVPEVKPAALVLVFIADDLRRSEMSRVWGAEKPYFEPSGDDLTLRNVPVPPSPSPSASLDVWQRLFGWSVLVDTILRHKGWQYEWSIDHLRVLPRGAGEAMACPLLKRLAGLGVPTLVVAEYDPYVWKNAEYAGEQRRLSRSVLDCARAAGLGALDLFDAIDEGVRRDGYAAMFRSSHPGPLGHRIAAERIAEALKQGYMPPR
ncbi:SGNH/GDSL hydrolase family protein [Reyranella sp.]|uniref:SGNH/GDSL hydrolase family protein n=1 Tax=Reyranella sp. TaxID=1929291 RepID=UPI003D13E2F3